MRALAVSLLLLVAAAGAGAEDTKFSALAGGVVSLGSDADAKLSPFVRIAVEAPVADGELAPQLLVAAHLTALPGEALNAEDPTTWHALEFSVGAAQRLARRLRFGLYVEAGFATRLPGDPSPREKTARWAAGGIRFASERGLLQLGMGPDQRLDGTYQPAVTITGGVKLWKAKSDQFKGAHVSLVGSAVLGVDFSARYAGLNGGRRDVVRVGIAAGR